MDNVRRTNQREVEDAKRAYEDLNTQYQRLKTDAAELTPIKNKLKEAEQYIIAITDNEGVIINELEQTQAKVRTLE